MPAGQNVPNPVPHPVHHAYPPFSQPSLQTQFLPSFQCCPSSQSRLSSFPQQEIQYPHSTMPQQHALPMNNENSPPINAHSGTISDYSGKFLVPSHPKVSGYTGTVSEASHHLKLVLPAESHQVTMALSSAVSGVVYTPIPTRPSLQIVHVFPPHVATVVGVTPCERTHPGPHNIIT